MSASLDRRIALSEAEALAHELLELLAPTCERLEIAGSIRRRRLDVGDIELLAAPAFTQHVAGLWQNEVFYVNELDAGITHLLGDGVLQPRQPKRLGPRYKALLYKDMPLDLFIVLPPAQWGLLMAIRTGPADFSQRLVTHQRQYGWLPNWAKVVEGGVYHETHKPGVDKPYPMPEEADVFDFLKREYIPPEQRR